jgi:hypothetical protein
VRRRTIPPSRRKSGYPVGLSLSVLLFWIEVLLLRRPAQADAAGEGLHKRQSGA